MDSLRISFCHHLSLSYFGGGEKWLINTAKELVGRGHEVEIYSLPFLLDGKPKINAKKMLKDICSYVEAPHHKVKADVVYITYNPLSWLAFQTTTPRIAGFHSHTYWTNPHPSYGLLPNISNIVNKFTSYFELRRFQAVHAVTGIYPINHPRVYHIPNFVDSDVYKPNKKKESNFTIAYASRHVWQKGWKIFTQLKHVLHNNYSFVISGQEPESEMPSFYSQAHVTLVPSLVDTFGLSIVESMLCETPVITTPLPTHKSLDLPLLYANSVCGYLERIKNLHSVWEYNRDNYNLFSQLCRSKALRYEKSLIMNHLENMFKEVALGG